MGVGVGVGVGEGVGEGVGVGVTGTCILHISQCLRQPCTSACTRPFGSSAMTWLTWQAVCPPTATVEDKQSCRCFLALHKKGESTSLHRGDQANAARPGKTSLSVFNNTYDAGS